MASLPLFAIRMYSKISESRLTKDSFEEVSKFNEQNNTKDSALPIIENEQNNLLNSNSRSFA